MQYAAYLDGFIPLSLMSVLLREEDPKKLSEVTSDLSKLSLGQVILNNEGKELGLQVHQEVQAFCREYQDWSKEATLGTRKTIVSKLVEILGVQMPAVEATPDENWQRAKLYAPHVATVVKALKTSKVAPSAVVARLLELMAQYSKQVALNYRKAESYYSAASEIYQTGYKDESSHLDMTSNFRNWGIPGVL